MEQIGQASYEPNAAAQANRLNAAGRCMAVYQQGLLALHRIRQLLNPEWFQHWTREYSLH